MVINDLIPGYYHWPADRGFSMGLPFMPHGITTGHPARIQAMGDKMIEEVLFQDHADIHGRKVALDTLEGVDIHFFDFRQIPA